MTHRQPSRRGPPWRASGIALSALLGPSVGVVALAAPPKVIVIGMDAASLNVVEPFFAQGVLPNLQALANQGLRGDLMSYWPMRTPQVWTSMVTGKVPGQHGIWDHYSSTGYNPPAVRTKAKQRLTTEDRRSKALWNILDAAAVRVMSVGWIASWPAETLRHGAIFAPPVLLDPNRQVSIKGSFWRDIPEQVTPAAWWPRMKPLIVEAPDLSDADLSTLADVPPPSHPIMKLPYLPTYIKAMKWSVARARTVEALSLAFYEEAQPDLMMVYFECSDSLSHRFWVFQKSDEEIQERLDTHKIRASNIPELRARFGRVVPGCYRDIDERVGRILAKARGTDTLVLVVSDHGFGEAPKPHPKKTEPYGGNHREEGIILAAAPWITPGGGTLSGASVMDLTPTLLHLFGQPVANDMRGKILEGLLDPASRARPVTRIESYEDTPQTTVTYPEGFPTRKERPLAEDS